MHVFLMWGHTGVPDLARTTAFSAEPLQNLAMHGKARLPREQPAAGLRDLRLYTPSLTVPRQETHPEQSEDFE